MGAAAAKKLDEPATNTPPDGSKPIELEYYYLPYNLGTLVQHQITVDGAVNDGCKVGGICRRIVLYPGGVAVAEVECGRLPGMLNSEQKTRTEYIVLTGGHGKVKQ